MTDADSRTLCFTSNFKLRRGWSCRMTASGSSTTLQYADRNTSRPRPTRHSSVAGWAWGMMLVEVIYKGSVIAYAYHRSPTWPWARFQRNVGDPELFIRIDHAILYVGAALAVAALLHPWRKRWAAWAALGVYAILIGMQAYWFVVNRS